MTKKSAICLVVDRLHAGFLGAYGNSWVRTPTFDRLASESLLFDAAIADSPDLDHLYRAYWQGQHALQPDTNSPALPAQLESIGVRSVLLTDDPAVAETEIAAQFGERIILPRLDTTILAESIEETEQARFFAAAIELVDQLDEGSLLWLHTRGMAGPWDAPLELREAFADEEDPDPLSSPQVPCRMLSADYDPDELIGITQAYAAQVSLWDACLGTLVDAIDESPVADDTLLHVLGARGFPLGEHLAVGAAASSLYGELLQLPWIMRAPRQQAVAIRTSQLVQPPDLGATLCEWWSLAGDSHDGVCPPLRQSLFRLVDENGQWERDRACSKSHDDEWAIRTRAWFQRGSKREGTDHIELFTKPDDRFETNEVATRCGDVSELLTAAYADFLQLAVGKSQASDNTLDELDPRLTSGLR